MTKCGYYEEKKNKVPSDNSGHITFLDEKCEETTHVRKCLEVNVWPTTENFTAIVRSIVTYEAMA